MTALQKNRIDKDAFSTASACNSLISDSLSRESENCSKAVFNWIYGGQNKNFFKEHCSQTNSHNRKSLNLLSMVLCTASGIFYSFNLNCREMPQLRHACSTLFIMFLSLFFMGRLRRLERFIGSSTHVLVVYQFSFALLLLVGPVYDSQRLACFIPVFFATAPLLTIMPMHFTGAMMLFDMLCFAWVTRACKGMQLGTYDIINGITCVIIGLAMGQSILKERMSSLAAYDLLKNTNESELRRISEQANVDSLTHVKNRMLYEAKAQAIDKMIQDGAELEFAIVVCDVNGLKSTNDNLGHSSGDALLQNSCQEICRVFSHSPVFRIGGDEFAVKLMGKDYTDRFSLLENLKTKSLGPPPAAFFAFGCSEYKIGADKSVKDVFDRADLQMYKDKKQRGIQRI